MLAGVGSTESRATVYHATINLVQSLMPDQTEERDAPALRQLATRLDDPIALEMFGLDQLQDSLESRAVHALTRELLVLLDAATIRPDTINAWRTRWLALVTENCFTPSNSIQARAFVVFAQVLNGDVGDELLWCVR